VYTIRLLSISTSFQHKSLSIKVGINTIKGAFNG
jgi:hypothetical protein